MIARASYGDPWIFNEIKRYLENGEIVSKPDIHERIKVCTIQLDKSVDWKGERRGVLELRKHWSNYFRGYPHFKPFRQKMMEVDTANEVKQILEEIRQYYY